MRLKKELGTVQRMQSHDDTAAATKSDVKVLMEMMGDISLSIEKVREEAKETKETLRREIKTSVQASEKRMTNDFKLGFELMRSDFFDAKKDRLAQHHDMLADHTRRIVRIEQKLSI